MEIEVLKSQYKLFKCLRFVCKATKTVAGIYALSAVSIEKERFVATDGQRLHIADIEHKFETGLYEVIKSNQKMVVLSKMDDPGRFPKWQDTVPEHKNYFAVHFYSADLMPAEVAAFGLAQKYIVVRESYLREVLSNPNDVWNIFYGDPDRPILCVYEYLRAIIMPVTPPKIKFQEAGVPFPPKETN